MPKTKKSSKYLHADRTVFACGPSRVLQTLILPRTSRSLLPEKESSHDFTSDGNHVSS